MTQEHNFARVLDFGHKAERVKIHRIIKIITFDKRKVREKILSYLGKNTVVN
jgi:hypothetical protein